jgi:hypothetical protein
MVKSRARLSKRAKLARAGNRISRLEKPGRRQKAQGTRRFVIPPYILTVRRKDGITEIVTIRHAQQGDAYAPEELLDDESSSQLSDESR